MKYITFALVDARYWTGITLASVFGTNLGDFYAHESGTRNRDRTCGVGFACGYCLCGRSAFENAVMKSYYWLVIILIRTGATNIADYLAYRVRVPALILTLGSGRTAFCSDFSHTAAPELPLNLSRDLPKTDAPYWLAMLTAGVFGTVGGDICEHAMGEGVASVVLTAVLPACCSLDGGVQRRLLLFIGRPWQWLGQQGRPSVIGWQKTRFCTLGSRYARLLQEWRLSWYSFSGGIARTKRHFLEKPTSGARVDFGCGVRNFAYPLE